jgi:hypothetical protein
MRNLINASTIKTCQDHSRMYGSEKLIDNCHEDQDQLAG